MAKKLLPLVMIAFLGACAAATCDCCGSDMCPMKDGKKCEMCAKHKNGKHRH